MAGLRRAGARPRRRRHRPDLPSQPLRVCLSLSVEDECTHRANPERWREVVPSVVLELAGHECRRSRISATRDSQTTRRVDVDGQKTTDNELIAEMMGEEAGRWVPRNVAQLHGGSMDDGLAIERVRQSRFSPSVEPSHTT